MWWCLLHCTSMCSFALLLSLIRYLSNCPYCTSIHSFGGSTVLTSIRLLLPALYYRSKCRVDTNNRCCRACCALLLIFIICDWGEIDWLFIHSWLKALARERKKKNRLVTFVCGCLLLPRSEKWSASKMNASCQVGETSSTVLVASQALKKTLQKISICLRVK